MKIGSYFISMLLILIFFGAVYTFGQEVDPDVKAFSEKLAKYITAPEIVSSIKAQNAKNVSLDKIKEIDKEWMATSGINDFMKNILDNTCSNALKKIRKENPSIIEAFATDDKGANVGMTNKTTDYWQGDEDKFIKCYNNGKGLVHFGKLAFDESSQAYEIQVSVPVNENGKTIGTVTFGVDIAKLKMK